MSSWWSIYQDALFTIISIVVYNKCFMQTKHGLLLVNYRICYSNLQLCCSNSPVHCCFSRSNVAANFQPILSLLCCRFYILVFMKLLVDCNKFDVKCCFTEILNLMQVVLTQTGIFWITNNFCYILCTLLTLH